MTPVTSFTPEILVTAPRRGPAVPNPDGTLAIFFQSTHVIGGTTSKGYQVLTLENGSIEPLIAKADEKATDAVWMGCDNKTVLYLSQGEGGHTWVKTIDASQPAAEPSVIDFIEAPVSELKIKTLEDGSIAIVVVGLVDSDGSLYNKEQHKTLHTARITDNINPRNWDSYVQQQKYTIWYTTIFREDGHWRINKSLKNVLAGTKLTANLDMYEPFCHTNNFDISNRGILFSATEEHLADSTNTELRENSIYHMSLDSLSSGESDVLHLISLQKDNGTQSKPPHGHCFHPRFSPNGSTIAFLRAPTWTSLDCSIWVKYAESQGAVEVFSTITRKSWNLTPSAFKFSPDGQSIYIEAPDRARAALYALDLAPDAVPTPVVRDGSVSSYHVLSEHEDGAVNLLVTSSSLVEPWICQIIQAKGSSESEPRMLSNITQHFDIGLSQQQISETHFKGAGDYDVHAWVIKPKDFDTKKKYPLCLLVHGGPYSAWNDAWSTRWNPAVWAEQGYIVVTPNITGSVGFGLEFAKALRNSWGGRAYDDLVKCLDHVKDIPGIDMENAVAGGNSYGGYMMNWIQGHDLGRRFKALVCHNGIFNLPTFLLESDTMVSNTEEFGGPPFPWANPEGIERYNPARPELLKKWKTPMLVIHTDLDYRVPMTSGIAAFHTLKVLGTPARFLNFPDENHWVAKEENSLEWHRQVFAWINQWSGVAASGSNTKDKE